MASFNYNEGIESILDRNIDFIADTIKAVLVGASYIPNKDTQFIDEAGANDVIDHAIPNIAGAVTLAGKAIAKDLTGDHVSLDAATDPVFLAVPAGSTAATVQIYKDTGTPTTSKLIASLDITDTPTNGGDITIVFATPATGGLTKFALV